MRSLQGFRLVLEMEVAKTEAPDPEKGMAEVKAGYGGVKDKSLWTKIGTKSCTLLSFNPVVTIISLAIILGFAVWAMLR